MNFIVNNLEYLRQIQWYTMLAQEKHTMLTDELLTFHVSRKCIIGMLALQSSKVFKGLKV